MAEFQENFVTKLRKQLKILEHVSNTENGTGAVNAWKALPTCC
jgi:hypothetical protein